VHELLVWLIRRRACARAQFSGCSSTTNAHSETVQVAICCQNLPLGALSSHSAPFLLVGALFKKFGLFLNTGIYYELKTAYWVPRILILQVAKPSWNTRINCFFRIFIHLSFIYLFLSSTSFHKTMKCHLYSSGNILNARLPLVK